MSAGRYSLSIMGITNPYFTHDYSRGRQYGDDVVKPMFESRQCESWVSGGVHSRVAMP